MRFKNLLLTAMLVLVMVTPALAGPNNEPPPAGAILDLNGQTITHSYAQLYSVDFTAALPNTAITFAFREDPAFIYFGNASVVDTTTLSSNLLTNGNFTGGVYTNNGNAGTPNGWTYANIYGASFGGFVATDPLVGGYAWYDGAVQAYDAISQTIATNPGDVYQISFYAWDDGGLTTFSDLSTNGDVTDTGGNGADILAYAQAGLPPAGNTVPEPCTMLLLGSGLVGLIAFRKKFRA